LILFLFLFSSPQYLWKQSHIHVSTLLSLLYSLRYVNNNQLLFLLLLFRNKIPKLSSVAQKIV
jgi:uncharacterized membrane protein YciS (DUF1049 family)